jgi:signal transduction histidine kinase
LIGAALLLSKSFFLTAISDVMQCLLLLSGTAAFFLRATRSRGRLRLFWTLMASGISLWFSYQLFWTYYEVWLRADVPDLCSADIILFLHIVPLMAALALRPHAPQDEYAGRIRRLDFALMVVWWIYLYVLIVIPWQYVVADAAAYGHNLNSLYLVEKLAFLTALFMSWLGSRDGWKVLYASLFSASLVYSGSSYVANWALSRHSYYSGSLYDIPLAVSMASITGIALWIHTREPQTEARPTLTSFGVWLARMGMIAAFSLPLFAAWALVNGPIPPQIRSFRLVLTLLAALLMGCMVFIRQRLLDCELLRLLTQSRESLANLKRLQAQITDSEKLASVGQLVGGAAHELNNPITAMLGYSDLLQNTSLNPEQTKLAEKIGQHVRRTRSLVASLLSFAKQSPATMVPMDLNGVLRTALKLAQPHCQALNMALRAELPDDLLTVRGDSNQLLQVCGQIINDALHGLEKSGGRALVISAQQRDGTAVICISDSDIAPTPAGMFANAPSPAGSSKSSSSLGLSACQGILRQHHGKISWQDDGSDGFNIRIEIPLIHPAQEKSSAVPPMLQPQPFA